MGKKLRIIDGSRRPLLSSFQVLEGTGVPDNGNGSNGDFYFRYNDGANAIYKKVSGAWQEVTGGGSSGYSGEQEFEITTSDVTDFVYTAGFEVSDKLDVWLNGARKFEGAQRDWTRDADTDKVIFNTGVSGSAENPSYVNIRKW